MTSRKKSKNKSKPKSKATSQSAATQAKLGSSPDTESFLQQVKQNRFGFVGFVLSMLQLAVHACWIAFVSWLSATGQAVHLQPGAWQLWLVMVFIALGALLTAISLFLCLYGSIHGHPKALAYVGLCVSFFVGAFTTFALLIQATAPDG